MDLGLLGNRCLLLLLLLLAVWGLVPHGGLLQPVRQVLHLWCALAAAAQLLVLFAHLLHLLLHAGCASDNTGGGVWLSDLRPLYKRETKKRGREHERERERERERPWATACRSSTLSDRPSISARKRSLLVLPSLVPDAPRRGTPLPEEEDA